MANPPADQVTPTCKYGHGNLERIKTGPTSFWGLVGAAQRPARVDEMRAGDPLASLQASGAVYTVIVYRCLHCGYMELFDDIIHG
jgi:hypothetical protein